MATTRSRRWLPDLTLHSLRHHRAGILGWVLAGGGVMWVFGTAYQMQMKSFAGGAPAFAQTASATAEAMRALVGPADRLDTYGGYVTFHNLSYATVLLGFWALVQGSKAIRGAEEKGQLGGWLVAGRARARVVVDRVAGFILAMALTALGIGLLTWFGTLAAGQPRLLPSLGAIAEVCLGATVFFALALLVSQLVGSSRTSSGITGALMLASYLVGNLYLDLGWGGWLKYFSPFWYVQQSRVLIPGHDVDIAATLALVGMVLAFSAGAVWAFARRDLGSTLWARQQGGALTDHPFRLRRPWLRTLWTAAVASQRTGLLFWFAGAAGWFAMYVAVSPSVMTYWKSSQLIRRLFAAMPAGSLADQYLSYIINLTAPLVAAFALVQAARWVRDSDERRTELELSCPVSRRRLWLERMAGLTVGAIVVVAGCVVGLVVGARAGGIALSGLGIVRSAADLLLLALAVGGVGAVIVATLRSGAAIGVLGGFLGLSFFVTLFGPLLSWPDWVMRLSVFQAFGAPYLDSLAMRDALFVAGVAVVGTAAAVAVAERRSAAP